MVLVVKNPLVNAGDIKDMGSVPGLGRFPGGGHGNPLQYSRLENPMDRGAWQATVNRVTHSQIQQKQLNMHAPTVSKLTVYLGWKKEGCLWRVHWQCSSQPGHRMHSWWYCPLVLLRAQRRKRGPAGWKGAYRMDGNYKAKERKSWEGRKCTTRFKLHHNVSLLFTKWSNT